jgi:hypothetical protein
MEHPKNEIKVSVNQLQNITAKSNGNTHPTRFSVFKHSTGFFVQKSFKKVFMRCFKEWFHSNSKKVNEIM